MAVKTIQEAGAVAADGAIRPFTVSVPEAEVAKLRDRLGATRWPSTELVDDWSQGVQLVMLRELARYWEIGRAHV